MKRVLVISTSPRVKSNSDALADEFIRGAKEAGHEVEKISIREKNIQFCKGCLACTKKNRADEFNRGEGGKIYFRDIYMLSTAAEDEEFVPKRAEAGLTGWIDCFEKALLKGTVFGGGVSDMGDIEGHPALQKAYEMGKNII